MSERTGGPEPELGINPSDPKWQEIEQQYQAALEEVRRLEGGDETERNAAAQRAMDLGNQRLEARARALREPEGSKGAPPHPDDPKHISEILPEVEKNARLIDESAQKDRKAEAEELGDVDWVTRPKVNPDEAE